MDSIFEHYKKTGYLHHAHLIEGEADALAPVLAAAIERHMGIPARGNPDFTTLFYETFGIDEGRELKERQSRAGFGAEDSVKDSPSRKIFIVCANAFTHEAQNSLLKTFEEPTEGTYFFIILPRLDAIIPTLKSRVILIDGRRTSVKEDDTKVLAEEFLDSFLEQRFTMAKKLTETKKDEPIDREKIRRILDHIERILYTRTAGISLGNETSKLSSSIFRYIFQAKTYLADRGSSPKMLLENLAMVISVK